MSDTIKTSYPADHVALIEIDNPPSNALGDAVRSRLMVALEEVENNLAIRAVVLTGTGKSFCAGDDLREVATRGDAMNASLAQFGKLFDRLEAFRVPVIAAVNGHAMGGGLELALCCDLRIASAEARFAGAGVNVGLMASVYRLPRLIGIARAKAMLLTGQPIDAETARLYGLVTAVHPASELRDAALTLATRIATRAPLSVEATKRQTGRAYDLTPTEAQRASGEEVAVLRASADHRAAVDGFLNKRTPSFTRS
ncbi:Short-chain-enoyl-CoA hydratase [Alphaproteobacteria bacterium SO-S41]|nr:Short-chain-enoyl-CoA hydratase [Alphaproteobacteria bacterium SO-S41]